ncbi:hypothetical protein FACS189429_4620 [Bacteroidia bacterium]|nr:hypothetical protein FACS189429_4620 [Bacteroidia bacterium]GHV44548.1 hypothetical protein FACS1894180_6020 [Bacteroidia bacterium]
MARLTFVERNKDTYKKVSNVSREIIDKYKDLLPNELIIIWETMGFGIYENGFIQLVNPDEYDFIFDYVDKLLEPSIVWGITALGDIVLWEGNKNRTISPEEGNRNVFINVRKCNSHVIGEMKFILEFVLGDEHGIIDKDYFASKPFLDIKDRLPPLEYGQCYGYVPALALGGSASSKKMKVLDNKSYINIIGQAAGKIIDLGVNKL